MSKHWYNNGIDKQAFSEVRPEGFDFDGMLESSKQKMREHKRTEEHKKNLSKSLKGRTASNKGIPASEEKKAKISETNKIVMNTPEMHEKLSKAKTGKHLSESHKKAIGDGNRGKTLKQSTRYQIGQSNSIALKGRHLSEEAKKQKLEREYNTKKKNNSFNTSKPEETMYKQLQEEYKGKTIYRNYKCERYPFYCDFYIVEDDLFIELNAHWTHGGKPFDGTDETCLEQLHQWQEKAKTSQFYENAIKTWTERDVEKQRIAKENNLNYKTIY